MTAAGYLKKFIYNNYIFNNFDTNEKKTGTAVSSSGIVYARFFCTKASMASRSSAVIPSLCSRAANRPTISGL